MAKGSVISITLTADDKTGKGIQSATANVEGFGNKMSGAASTFATFAGVVAAQALPQIVDFGKEMFSLGTEVETMGRKADTVFGDQATSIKDWADENNEALGISDEKLVGLAASMGDLLVPMGFTRQAAANLTTETLDAAGALAAWSGGQYDAAEVSNILTKAMLGEREQLKSLGISINQAEVDQRAMAIATADGRDEITAMDKALATQQLILEKSTDAQAAWGDGTMDNVKAQAELKAMIDDAKVAIARGLTPVIQKFVGFIVKDLIPGIKSVVDFIRDNWIPIVAGLTAAFVVLVPSLLAAAAAGWAAVAPMLIAAAPIIAVGAAIAGLTAGVMWLYENWTPFHEAVDATVKFFTDEVLPVFQTIVSFIVDELVPVVWSIAEMWIKIHLKIAEIIAKVVGAVAGFVSDVIGWIVDTLLPPIWSIAQMWIDIHLKIAEVIITIVSAVAGFVADVIELVANLVTGIWEKLQEIIAFFAALPGQLWEALGDMVQWGVDLVVDIARGIASAAGQITKAIMDAVPSPGDIVGGIVGGLGSVGGGIAGVFGFANGTNYAPGGLALVGERGPELVNLPRGSQVIPNNQLGGAGMDSGALAAAVAQGMRDGWRSIQLSERAS